MINIEDLSKIHLTSITSSSDNYINGHIDGDDEFSMFMQDLDHVTGGFTKSTCRTYKASNKNNGKHFILFIIVLVRKS